MRQVYKQSARQVMARRATAHNATKSMVGVTLVAIFVAWLVLNLNRIM
ncbi:hypothetical protein GCM10009850_088050 [Nonomuraea monospora]|uniref:Transposase n=2 Tax=Nonomuraea monospora TaxID=568818 RepID=A0ABP5PNR7_9ACTN